MNMWVHAGISVVLMSTSCFAGVKLHLRGGLSGSDEATKTPVTVLCEGDEYTLQVVNDGPSGHVTFSQPPASGAYQLSSGGTGSSISIVNGKRSEVTTTTYYLQPRQTGTFTVGPATVGGQTSNAITVKVVDAQTYDRFAGKSGALSQSLSCTMTADKQTVYVGQPITVTITMEDSGDALSRGLQPPVFGKLTCTPVGGLEAKETLVNGRLRVVSQQRYTVTADSPGAFTIAPAYAHFVVPDEQRMDPFAGFFGSFLSAGGKKRAIRSNSLMLTVKPLPATYEHVDGIGAFTSIEMKYEKDTVELNEPFTATLTIKGAGNFDMIMQPRLDVGDAVSVYNSSQKVISDQASAGGGAKVFEYLLQINEPGEHEIGSQSFHYFDTVTERYETLTTEPKVIVVKKAKIQSAQVVTPHEPEAPSEEPTQTFEVEADGHTLPIAPWSVMLFFAVLMFLVAFRKVLLSQIMHAAEVLGITSQHKREAAQLDRMIQARETGKMYPFFTAILGRAWNVESDHIDTTYIQYKTAEWEWDSAKREQFSQFIDMCSQAAFAPQFLQESAHTKLLESARYWHGLVMHAMQERGQ